MICERRPQAPKSSAPPAEPLPDAVLRQRREANPREQPVAAGAGAATEYP
jgi:hypothetical protein